MLSNVSLHLVDGEGLLLDAARARLYALNPCATFIWSRLTDGRPPAAIARDLVEQLALPDDTAGVYVDEVMRQCEVLRQAPDTEERPRCPTIVRSSSPAVATENYRLLGSVLAVSYASTELHAAIHPLIEHNAVHARVNQEIFVAPAGAGVTIATDDELMGATPTLDTAAVALRACLIQLAVRRSGGLCAVHAGALCREGGALLLPGEAGDGKSTLSAGLAASGFEMLSDDTTLLSGNPLLVRSMPIGLCIKRGAYPVLAPLFPRLASLPEWRRPDGRDARYLTPGEGLPWAAAEAAAGVRWMVFPHYQPGGGTRLLALQRPDALVRLLRGAYFLSGALDGATLDRMIDWIESVECYSLPLDSLDTATGLLRELCA